MAQVISLTKLRTEFIPYEAKRKLLQSYDLFIADHRRVPAHPPYHYIATLA